MGVVKQPDARDVAEDANLRAMFGERVEPERTTVSCDEVRGVVCTARYEPEEPEDVRTHTCALPAGHLERHRCPRCGVEWTVKS